MQSSRSWTYKDSRELYGIANWSAGFFDIAKNGDVIVKPFGNKEDGGIHIHKIINGLKERGVNTPILLRFGNILETRIVALNEAFRSAIKETNYKGPFRGVYPIKVNQQQQVIEQIVNIGRQYHYGLEVGSKPELMAAMAYLDDREAYIICNGYKDEEFIEIALYARKMGFRIILVLEMISELDLILDCAEKINVTPMLGVRVKLSSKSGSHWAESGGDLSPFGLNASEITHLLDELKRRDKLTYMKMLHYHLGSQVPDIASVRNAILEASQFYVNFIKEGAPLEILDIGGGIAVDYDGSNSNSHSSCNYSINEYCVDICEVISEVMDANNVPHPTIISESGRAIVAYHSVLVFDILKTNRLESSDSIIKLPKKTHKFIQSLWEIKDLLNVKSVQECYHDAFYYIEEIRTLFLHGGISLRDRALGERIFWHIVTKIVGLLEELDYVPDELKDIEVAISDIYYGNFSVFQSLPDFWAIDQLFPILPIHRLNERPTRKAKLSDITCDSDGKIDKFIHPHNIKKTLPLHALKKKEYYLGVFMVGAYQETLGDLHNLLGDPNVVGVKVDKNGDIEFSQEIMGDSVADVLSYVEYDPKELIQRMRKLAEKSVLEGRIQPNERKLILESYEAGLRGYTYYLSKIN
jgi:arginine decarboxylase